MKRPVSFEFRYKQNNCGTLTFLYQQLKNNRFSKVLRKKYHCVTNSDYLFPSSIHILCVPMNLDIGQLGHPVGCTGREYLYSGQCIL